MTWGMEQLSFLSCLFGSTAFLKAQAELLSSFYTTQKLSSSLSFHPCPWLHHFPLLPLLLFIILASQAHNSAAYLHHELLDLRFNSLQGFSGHVHEPCSQENTSRNAAQEAEDPVVTT